MKFETYLVESTASDEAHELGLTAAGWGLWRDKTGKVVKKTQDGKLVDVRGSAAKIEHYHINIPSNEEANHAEHDQSSDIVAEFETKGTHRESEISKVAINEHSAVSKENAKKMHDALVGAGYAHRPSPFGQMYTSGGTSIMISNHPETSHKRGGKEKDHHTVLITTKHKRKKKTK